MYHHISLILCLLYSPRPLLPIPAVITHLRQSPSFLSTRAQPSFQIPTVCVPPPAVRTYTLPSSDAPYIPPPNPSRPPISPTVRLPISHVSRGPPGRFGILTYPNSLPKPPTIIAEARPTPILCMSRAFPLLFPLSPTNCLSR